MIRIEYDEAYPFLMGYLTRSFEKEIDGQRCGPETIMSAMNAEGRELIMTDHQAKCVIALLEDGYDVEELDNTKEAVEKLEQLKDDLNTALDATSSGE